MRKYLYYLLLFWLPFIGNGQLLNETFEGTAFPPTGWTITQTSPAETWYQVNAVGGWNTTKAAGVDYDGTNQQNEWLISPSIDLSGETNAWLSFFIGYSYYWGVDPNDNYDVFVKASTDNGTTWTEIWSENEIPASAIPFALNNIQLDLEDYVGESNLKIAFQYSGFEGAGLYIDNVVIRQAKEDYVYCTPYAAANDATGITSVSFNTINQTSTGTGAYTNNMSISTDVDAGSTHNLTVKVNTGGNYTVNVDAWIDWNSDGFFDEATEEYDLGTATNVTDGASSMSPAIMIPMDVSGEHRLRIRAVYGATTNPSPCGSQNYSEAEDYMINVNPPGCLTAPNQFPSATINLGACPANYSYGTFAGTYHSKVNVVSGTEYTIKSSVSTDFITISNPGGTTVYASGTGTLIWTAGATETIRVFIHKDDACTNENVIRNISLRCGDFPVIYEDPDFACFMGNGGTSNLENGLTITATDTQRIADDFVVDAGTEFTLQQITINVLSATEITNATLNIRADNAGVPGAVVNTGSMTPTSSQTVGTSFGIPIRRLVFDLTTPFELPEGTYWLDPTAINSGATGVYWETSSTLGNADSSYIKGSGDSGTTWTLNAGTNQAIFYVAGECNEVDDFNDDCYTATMLTVGADFAEFAMTGTLVDATDSGAGEPDCGDFGWDEGDGDVWYSFVAPASGNAVVETKAADGSEIDDTAIQVYLGACDALVAVDCSDDDGDGAFSKAILSGLTPGETYYVRVWEYGGDVEDTFRVSAYEFVRPANDDCENAIALVCDDNETGATSFAADSGGNEAGDVFYTFTGDGTEQEVTVSLCGSDYDTVVRVFSDCTMTEDIAMNDDSDECGDSSVQSNVSFTSDGTSTYVIMVEGFGVNTGNFMISVSCGEVPEGCQPALNCTDGDLISNVTFAGINNDTDCSPEGYGDYTDQVAEVEAGMSYDLSVTVGAGWYERVSAWIDWNQDGMFDADEFLGEIGDGGQGVTVTESVMIPAGTANGMYAMRLLAYATGSGEPAIENPCINDLDQFGEYEDYTISVGEGPVETNCEDQVVPSNNIENGLLFADQSLAVDVTVGDAGYLVYGTEINIIVDGNTDLSFSAIFYEDEAGAPGAEYATTTGTVVSSELIGNISGFDVYKYTVAFTTPVDLVADTTYWMQIESDGFAWESTTATILGSTVAFMNSSTGGEWAVDPDTEMVYDLICEELGVSDMNTFEFSYYPNPVKDVLNISAKKAVNNVSVYNLAGQQVLGKAKVSSGQIDVTSLTPGVYVFRVMLEGGQVETFKIIKK